MSDQELKIGVFADVEKARKSFNELTTQWKELRKELNATKAGTDDYNIAEKEFLKVANQRADWQKRLRTEIAKTRDEYFALGSELRRQTLPAMTSFSQIIQDAPYGIRGIGNNIEFLTQQLTMLSAKGVAVTRILKGMWSNIVGPAGLLLGVSIVTSLATVLSDKFAPSVSKVKEEQKKLNDEIEKEKRLREDIYRLQYETGEISSQKYINQIRSEIEELKKKRNELVSIWFLENKAFVAPTVSLRTPGFSTAGASATAVNKDLSSEEQLKMRDRKIKSLELTKQILDLQKILDGIDKKSERSSFEGLRSASSGVGLGEITYIKSIDDFLSYQKKHPTALVGMPDGSYKMAYQVSFMEFVQFGKVGSKVKTKDVENIDPAEMAKQIEEDTKKNLVRAESLYNSLFFDPLRAGFESLITGSKRFGDAIVESLKRMLAKLAEMAVFSGILSLLGFGGFMPIMGALSGLGNLGSPVSVTGGGVGNRPSSANVGYSQMTSNMMAGSSARATVVEVVGKLKSGDIYLSSKNYEAMQKAIKI